MRPPNADIGKSCGEHRATATAKYKPECAEELGSATTSNIHFDPSKEKKNCKPRTALNWSENITRSIGLHNRSQAAARRFCNK
jgi:hypothetical protein